MMPAENKEKENNKQTRKTWLTSILLVLLALVSISLTSLAWFSIADNTRLQGISMDVTTGPSLRFDLDPHPTFDEYIKTLTFGQIADRIKRDEGYNIATSLMAPVTTKDCSKFTYEDGSIVPEGRGIYITFTLNFMSLEDMKVHLTTADAYGKDDGTDISSKQEGLKEAMRIAFVVDDKVMIYDPGKSGDYTETIKYEPPEVDPDGDETDVEEPFRDVTVFGLYDEDHMVYRPENALFEIKKDENKVVQVYIWLEGTDEMCTNKLKGSDYAISMRFQGTDEDDKPLLSE